MAVCIDCGTALPSRENDCPSCRVRRDWTQAGRKANVCASLLPMDSEMMMISEVRLVSAAGPGEARRTMADDGTGRAGRLLAITGLILAAAAILMILSALVVNPPWN